ncbi:MAG: hypothetical protein ACYS14_03995, partial [Planctomycetota bacterium]
MDYGTLPGKVFRYRQSGRALLCFVSVWLAFMTLPVLCVDAGTVVQWDFSSGMYGWKGNHYVTDLVQSRQGLTFVSAGVDPWIEGPAVNLRTDRLTKVTVRMKSNANSMGELFYGPYFQAGRSVRFAVDNDGNWHEYELLITESLGAGTRFRLDPATSAGRIGVAFIRVDELVKRQDPPYLQPTRSEPDEAAGGMIRSGSVTLQYVAAAIGDFVIEVGTQEMAAGYRNELLGVLFGDTIEWLDLSAGSVTTERDSGFVTVTAQLSDSSGGTWEVRRELGPGPIENVIAVDVQIQVDTNRDVMCIPWLTIFPGLGTFGPDKKQALFAGLEYLADEPSSSQADISTTEHIRRVPDPVKVTFPLMAVSTGQRYIGLIWERSEWIGPVFDSPDRIFGSGAHVMALTGPAVGQKRFENSLLAHTPRRLTAHEPINARMWIIGGEAETVAAAVRTYVDLHGLPPVPQFEGGLQSAARLLAHGWVYSKIRQGGLFRHAVWDDRFGAVPAPDAAMFIAWLAVSLSGTDAGLIAELDMARDFALTSIPEGQRMDGGVSHVRPPAAPLLFGDIEAYVQRRYDRAVDALGEFDVNGVKEYRPGDI